MTVVLVVVGLLVWVGATLILDGLVRWRRRPSLYERLLPYQPTVADEAEDWLNRR